MFDTITENFKNMSVNIFETGSFTKFDERDPGTNFFDDITKSNFETSYFKPKNQNRTFEMHSIWKNLISYMSIRSIKRNFENLKAQMNLFSQDFNNYFNNYRRRGGALIIIKKNLSYKLQKDFSQSDEHKEILSLEISCKNSSNILLSCCYKPPNGILSMFSKQVFKKSAAEKKPYYLIGDLNRVPKKSATIIDNVITTNTFDELSKNA